MTVIEFIKCIPPEMLSKYKDIHRPKTTEHMGYARKDVEKTKQIVKKLHYPEGARRYSLGLTKFQELAKKAKAAYKIDKVALQIAKYLKNILKHSVNVKKIETTLGLGATYIESLHKDYGIFL